MYNKGLHISVSYFWEPSFFMKKKKKKKEQFRFLLTLEKKLSLSSHEIF